MNYPEPPAELIEDWIELAKPLPNRPPDPNKLAALAAAWGYQQCAAEEERAAKLLDEIWAEELFQDWFTSNSGPWTFLCEYFYGDLQEPDLKTREKLMVEWLKTAFKTGCSYGMPSDDKV